MFLEISQNSQENTCARVSFSIKLHSGTDDFCEFCETSKNTFLENTSRQLLLKNQPNEHLKFRDSVLLQDSSKSVRGILQKMKFSVQDVLIKGDQIHRFLRGFSFTKEILSGKHFLHIVGETLENNFGVSWLQCECFWEFRIFRMFIFDILLIAVSMDIKIETSKNILMATKLIFLMLCIIVISK